MILNNKYHVETLINSGAFGNVYLCSYKNKKYALKEELHNLASKYEAKIYKEVKNLKNICLMHDCFIYSNKFYLVLDYFDTDLTKFKSSYYESCCNDGSSSYYVTIKNIIKTVILTLKELHNLGYVHRDMKPSNICLNSKFEPYIIDFGLSKKIIENTHINKKNINSVIGSFNFVSLNVINLIEPSRRDDIEAIIYILIYLLMPEYYYLEYDTIDIDEKKKVENISVLLELLNIYDYEKIITMLKYIRKMTFTQMPNYEYIATSLFF